MKILICDDQVEFLNEFEKLLYEIAYEFEFNPILISFIEPNKALKYIEQYRDIDVVFMDILMGEFNGYKIAKEINLIDSSAKIIFISSTASYAIKGYEVNAFRYLIKPLKKEKLLHVLREIIYEFQYEKKEFTIEKNDSGIYKIFLSEIIYIETFNRNTMIHTIAGDILSYKSMKEHQARLNNNFIRCHSSYIVNMEFIKSYQGYEIYLMNKDKIWVSKNRRKEFLYSLTKFYGRQLE